MKRLWMAVLAVSLCGCSALNSARSGDFAGAASNLADTGVDAAQAAVEIDKQCAPLEKDAVGYQEERSMGGSVAVAAALHLAPLRIQPTKADSEAALKEPSTLPYEASARFNAMTREVARIGAKLGARSSRPDIFWTFGVLDSPDVNAFSTPGGYVFVTTGLLRKVTTEDALAGVLAHEITHVTNRDAIHAYLKEKVWGCRMVLGAKKAANAAALEVLSHYGVDPDAAFGAFNTVLGTSDHKVNYDDQANRPLVKLLVGHLMDTLGAGYAQDQEFAADHGAVELAANAGFDPAPFIALVKSLPESASTFAHHPPGADRAAKMTDQLAALRKSDAFIDWASIDKRKNVSLAAAIRDGASEAKVASDPAP